MKAIITTKYGPPEVLQIREVAKPAPAANEILIKVRATTVNVGDCRMRAFRVPPIFWLPARLSLGMTGPRNPVLGMELAGDVEAVGSAVTRFKPGDAVCASTFTANLGGHAEYKCLPEDGPIMLKPANLSYEEAAAVPVGALTALFYLKQAQIARGQSILIIGASGSVGSYGVQLARYFGADVTAVCSAANVEMVRALGANHVIDYTAEDFTKIGKTYDIVFDAVGKTTFGQCQHLVRDGGAYLHTVLPEAALIGPWVKMTTGKRIVAGTMTENAEDLAFLKELIEAGELRPVIDRCYPLEETAAAHRYVDLGHKKGNVVLTVEQAR